MKAIKYLVRISWAASIAAFLGMEARAELPDPIAGPDMVVADFDGDQAVTIRLNGSASSSPDGAIVSYVWTWPGGTATGATPEVVFPVSNGAITVSLAVTDVLNQSATDTLEVAVYDKDTALFTDFRKQNYRDIGAGLEGYIAGNLLVIDTGPDEVYRRNGSSWVQESFPVLGGNQFKVDANTVVTLNPGLGGTPSAIRYAANVWTPETVTFSPSDTILDGFNNQRVVAMDPQTVVIADYGSDHVAADGGRARVYHWSGNNWVYQTDLTPPGGIIANGAFGKQVEVRGDCIVVSGYNSASGSAEFHLFRRTSGVWAHEITFDGKRSVSDPVGVFNWGFGLGNNVLAATRSVSGNRELAIYEKQLSGWNQRILSTGDGANAFEFVEVDSDGDAIAASGFSGADYLFKRPGADWQTGSIPSQLLLTTDNPSLRISDFSDNLLTMRDGIAGVIRVIDTTTNVFPINVEPVADAGLDIQTTSYDGEPVPVFLNAGASFDIDGTIDVIWTWPGGGATGLYAFAMIPPDVTSIVLRVTDNLGAISTDSIAVNIVSPPVIDVGIDRVVVDTNGDGSVYLNVSGQVLSSDHPIVSYSWTWPGGVFSGQSGVINLGPAADGRDVTLTVVDSAGLSSQSSFRFTLMKTQPVPDIIVPANAQNNDLFGYSVAINGGSAMVGALNKPATYQLENINGIWQQISLSPGAQQGSAVALANDFAFSGAFQGTGNLRALVKTSGVWNLSTILYPPPNNMSGVTPSNFGLSIARSGDRLVVGAPRSTIQDGANFYSFAGAAFIYRLVNGSWVFEQRLRSASPETEGEFGNSVAIHGQRIAIGSSKKNGDYNSGIVEVFELGTVWNHVATLDNNPVAAGDSFGRSVAINDTEILAGAPGQGIGQVYRYKKNAGVWQANGLILPTPPPSGSLSVFGSSLSLKGNVLVVGVPGDASGTKRGGVQTFQLRNGNWEHRDSLAITTLLDPALVGSNFIKFAESNSSLSHDGRNLIVGAYEARNSAGIQSGKAYIYRNYAPLDPDANYEPLANAGADLSVNDTIVRGPAPDYVITEPLGSELVALSASASTDQENAITSYAWTWPGGNATGASPSARFPVGKTTVTLTVTDNKGVVDSDTVEVTVTLQQTAPASLPVVSGNTLTVDLPSSLAKWRLSSEFLWHADNESTSGVEVGAIYQVEILPYPGSTEVISTFITVDSTAMSIDLDLQLPAQPAGTASLSFPETSQGFSWRLVGESAWRDVTDDGDELVENVELSVPTGLLRVEFKPVAGFTTPQTRLVNGIASTLTALDWAEYLRINSYNPAKTFELAATPDLSASPYQYVGMIRSALGRGTGTVVADRVVLTAAHLFFDSNGLQWADAQWHSRQQQGTRQAPPIAPRGVLYQTSYAKLIAPDSVEGTVADLPEDPQQVDFAVLFFADQATWDQGSANFLQSTPAKNWLTGGENKHAVAYPQRSQTYENRGKIFQKQFATPLESLGTGLYETTEVFGDGGASGSALFVQPGGSGSFYPAAILLAGQGRAVYRIIDEGITRMIRDGADAATGNDDVLNNDSSLVVFNGLGSLTTIGVQVFPEWLQGAVRWNIAPFNAAAIGNMPTTQRVAFNTQWNYYTISFSAVSGFITPAPFTVFNGNVARGFANIRSVTYVPIPPPPPPPTPLETWVALYSITDMNADDDKDGMSALLEYALDRNPDQADYQPALLLSDHSSQSLYAEFDVYVSSAAAGVVYQVKASDSLDRSNAVTLATFTNVDGSSAYRKVTDTQLRSASQTRFAWVEIEIP